MNRTPASNKSGKMQASKHSKSNRKFRGPRPKLPPLKGYDSNENKQESTDKNKNNKKQDTNQSKNKQDIVITKKYSSNNNNNEIDLDNDTELLLADLDRAPEGYVILVVCDAMQCKN